VVAKKKLRDMTDKELLDMLDVPEEDIEQSVLERVEDISNYTDILVNTGEMLDVVAGILEERHGEEDADRIIDDRWAAERVK
jgi:hypothetical protein